MRSRLNPNPTDKIDIVLGYCFHIHTHLLWHHSNNNIPVVYSSQSSNFLVKWVLGTFMCLSLTINNSVLAGGINFSCSDQHICGFLGIVVANYLSWLSVHSFIVQCLQQTSFGNIQYIFILIFEFTWKASRWLFRLCILIIEC